MTSPNERPIVRAGLFPWLPWPLRGMRWWSAPIRAERLAALRIGLSLCVLADILTSYWPNLQLFYGPDSIGTLDNFNWYAQKGQYFWSILRGPADDLNFSIALLASLGLTVWFVGDMLARVNTPKTETPRRNPWLVAAWCMACGLVLWAYGLRILKDAGLDWKETTVPAWIFHVLEPWILSHGLVAACMIAWMIALVFLLAGFKTRGAAVACWILSTSFANVNPNIDNAGDTIRAILLFYLMLCPCAAVWSVDAWLTRKQRPPGAAIVVSPWPARLLFVQLVLMYFLNGAYKVLSADWWEGRTLYYVLHDTTLTRFSFEQLPLDYPTTQMLSYAVLAWELTFPLLVLWRPTRILALCFGVFFHLGIGVTMDLGFFVPYALCLYLPLAPWEWWADRGEKSEAQKPRWFNQGAQ